MLDDIRARRDERRKIEREDRERQQQVQLEDADRRRMHQLEKEDIEHVNDILHQLGLTSLPADARLKLLSMSREKAFNKIGEYIDQQRSLIQDIVKQRAQEEYSLLREMIERGILEDFDLQDFGKILLHRYSRMLATKESPETSSQELADLPKLMLNDHEDESSHDETKVKGSSTEDNPSSDGKPPTNHNVSTELEEPTKNFKISVANPKLLSKRFESNFLVQVYLAMKHGQVLKNIRSEFKDQEALEHIFPSSIRLGQRITVKFSSPEFHFSDSVVKLIDKPVNKIVFLGMPLDNCEPGLHKILVSISDAENEQEFESFTIGVQVVDFAFDHVSRPLFSRVSAAILGIGSFAIFILTFLEQIDKTLGYTSGTAAGVMAAIVYANFYNLYQRIRPHTP